MVLFVLYPMERLLQEADRGLEREDGIVASYCNSSTFRWASK